MCPSVRAIINGTPMERGETSRLYTLGSPIASGASGSHASRAGPLFRPQRGHHHPGLVPAWINVLRPDDVIGYPLQA